MVADTPPLAPGRPLRRLWRGLLPRHKAPDWEPTRLPRGMSRDDATAVLKEYLKCKEMADPWNKRAEAARALIDDIPSDIYGGFRLRRYKPRKIFDQRLARKIIESVGGSVPWTFTKAPIKVDRV